MEIFSKKYDSFIERLSGILNSIKSIYDQLNSNYNNLEETRKIQEYLDLAIEVEDNILNEIGEDTLFDEKFINRFTYLVQRSDLKYRNEVIERFQNYIYQKGYLNPFLSREKDPNEARMENYVTIKNQASIDYFKDILINIDNALIHANENEKKKLITTKNNVLYNYKIIANLIKNNKNHKIDGRNRCIVFNQDEKLVADTYKEYAYSIINYCFYSILIKDDNLLENIELRCALDLLDKSEIFEVARSYHKAISSDPTFQTLSANNPNHEKITSIIKEYLEKYSKKEFVKK